MVNKSYQVFSPTHSLTDFLLASIFLGTELIAEQHFLDKMLHFI